MSGQVVSLEQRHHGKDPGGLWNHSCPTAAEVGPCRGRDCFFSSCTKIPFPQASKELFLQRGGSVCTFLQRCLLGKQFQIQSPVREGNGNPLQCSCLENPRTGEPGGLPSYGVAQSRTRLKRLSSSSSSSSKRHSLEGLMLKLQYFGHLIRRADSLEKILMLGKTEGRRRSG